jgi:hypothetical protein
MHVDISVDMYPAYFDSCAPHVLPQVCLLDAISEVTLASRPYRYHPRLTRKPNQQFKWLMPFVLAGQVSILVLLPLA